MAETAKTGLVFDVLFAGHEPGAGHPESPDRYRALNDALRKARLLEQLPHIESRAATEEEILRAHTLPYLRTVQHDTSSGLKSLSTGDTALGEGSYGVALQAAGSVLNAVDAVMAGRMRNAFAAVRPPGHHATATRGMGFCLFNNVAIAAQHARRKHGVDRVLIVDWDVHHGNGTQDIFYEEPGVFFFSTHQAPWYPGTGAHDETGAGRGKGTTLNCPFSAGAGHAEIVGAFRRRLVPLMQDYRPALVLISAGFDSRRGDPLGRFLLKDADFAEMTRILLEIAEQHCAGRVVSVLEGGYSLEGLASATVAHLNALRGQ